jgi:antitoxin YefM
MDTIPFTAAGQDLAKAMDKVCAENAPLMITRQNEPAVVLMSLADYQSLEETAYLLRSPSNARRLLDSVAQLESGGGQERELVD